MPWRKALGRQIIEHDIYFNGVSLEDLIDFSTLQQVTKVGQTVEVLIAERGGNASTRDSDATKRHLTEVALRRCRCTQSEDILTEG